ncbi:MAG: autotransporter-associated beta strand repeat-containing protein [Planctomycetia bacterium]
MNVPFRPSTLLHSGPAARAVLVLLLACASCAVAQAQTSGTWGITTGGTWGDSANWSGNVIASGTGAVADFSTQNITGVQTVTLNAPVTTGTLLFGDTTGANGGWTLTSSTLTLATVSGVPTISVTGLGNSSSYGTNAVTIQSVIAGSNGLTKSGSSALVLSAANTYSGATTVGAGFLVVNNASALGSSSSVTVNGSGALAIGSGITIGTGKALTQNSTATYGGITALSGGTGTWAGSVSLGSAGNRIGYQNNSVLVLSGSIGGSNPLIISGADTGGAATSINTQYGVIVSGTNNGYTGATQIGRGVLKIGADNALPITTTLDIKGNVNGTEAAGFDLNGYNQTVAVLASSLIYSSGTGSANTGAASAFLTNSGSTVKTFTVNQATTGTFYGMITGNLAFTKGGTGNLTLTPMLVAGASSVTTGTSTFSGDTFVSAGTLTLGNATALFGSTFDTASTGTLSLGTLSAATFGGLKGTGTFALTNSGSAFALSVGGNGASSSFAGTLNGLGGLTKVGTGTFTMTGSSGYSGATTLAGGAFALGGANAIPASGTITFSGGALQYSASNTTDYTARIANSGSAVAIDTNGQSVTFTGGIDSTNTGGLRKLGAGTLTLSGSSGYSGATTLAGGVLALGNANSLPASGNVTFTGGTLQYSASNTSDLASRIASSTAAISIDTNGQSVTWAGNVANTNTGGLTKTGSGLLTLSGSNTFTGVVSVTSGTLAIAGANAFPTGVTGVSLNGGVLQATGSVSPSSVPSGATITLGSTGGTLLNSLPNQTQWYIYAPIAGGAGSGPLSLSGTSGEFILNSSMSSYAGGTLLSAPGVAIGTDAALGTGTITFAGGGLRATSAGVRTLSNAVTISAGATFYGSGTSNHPDVVFTGPITLTGSTQTVTTTLSSGSTFNGLIQFNGSVGDGGNAYGLTKAGAGTLVLGGSNTYSGTTTLNAGTLRLNNADALTGGGNLTFTGGTLQYSGSNTADYSSRIVGSSGAIAIDTNGQNVSFTSALAAGNAGGLTKSGSGTLRLTANNAYTGLTTVSGGTLQIGSGGATGSIAGNVALSNTAALVFNRSNDLTFAGSISGTGSLMKSGAGTLTLSGSSTLATGAAITINGGALVTTSADTLNSGASTATYAYTIDSGTLVSAAGATGVNSGFRLNTLSIGPGGATIRSDLTSYMNGAITGTSPTASLTYGQTSGTASAPTMVIIGNNTYAGGTKLESRVTISVDSDNAFGTGTLELAGASIYSRALTPTPRSVTNAVTISANTVFNGLAANPNLTFTGVTLLSGGTRTLQVDNVITSGTSVGKPGVIFTNTIGDGGNGYGLTKTGAGVLGLGGANTYTGVTTLNAGTIQLQNQLALQNSTLSLSGTGGVVFDSVVSGNAFSFGGLSSSNTAATLALQNSAATAIALTVGGNNASTTFAGSLTGSGSLEKVGAGTLILSASNTHAGTTTVTGGTLQVGGGGTTGSLAGNVANNAALVFSRSDASTYAGGISGSGSVTKSGAGLLTFSGSNSYAGDTTLAGGSLGLAGANALPASGNVVFTGGSLQYSGTYTTDLSGRIVNSTGAVAIDTNGQSISFASSLAATNLGGLTKLGSGTLSLSVANALTGPVTVGGGVLAVGNAGALPASGNVTFTGGTLQYSGSYAADLSARVVGSTAAISIDTNGQNSTWTSSLANTNIGGLTKSGNGTLTLSASNAYSGATTVNAGILLVNNAAALGSGSSVSVSTNGAALTIGSGVTAGAGSTVTVSSNGANSDGGLNVLSGTGTWAGNVILNGRLGYNNGNLVITGSVGGSSFTISGFGGDTNTNVAGYAVTLAGPTGYSGATSILRGWLKIGADNTLPVGTTLDVFTAANNSAAAQAATFDLNGFNQTVAGLTSSGNNGKTGYANGYVTNTGASVKTLTVNQSTSGTFGGLITGNLAFTKTGAGNLTLMPIFVTTPGSNAYVNGTNTFSGDTLVSAGTLTLSSATTSTSLALAGSTFDSSGAGSLSFGSMTAATFGGLKGSGTLALQNGSSQAVALTVGANGGSNTFSGGLSGAGSLVKSGAGTLTLSGSNGYTGSTTIGAGVLALGGVNALAGTGTVSFTGGTLQYGAGVSTDVSGLIRGSSSAIQVDTNGQNVTFAGAINNTNAAGLVKNGAGTLTFSGSNAYSGNTTVNAGTLAFTTDSVWAGLSGTVALNGATLAYTGTTVSNQTLYRPISLGASGGTLTNPGAAYWYLSGQISGTGALTVASGSSLMVLQGANTNSGGVTLQAGSQVVVGNDSAGPAGAPTSGVFGTGVLTLSGGSLRSTTGAARTVGNAVNVTADTTFFSAGYNTDKSLTFTGPVTLSGGSRTFTVDTTGTGNPATIFSGAIGDGGNGYGLTKAGVGMLVLDGSSTYTGATSVAAGSLVVNGSILSAVALSGSTSLGGRGSVGAISGAGLVGPGNSPGILTAPSVDPTGGLSFAFEFTQAAPNYAIASASGNDLLSLTGGTPFTTALTSANTVNIYFTQSAVELGTLTGGFFTSLQSDFLNSISSATFQYFVQDAAGSTLYNGSAYKTLAQYDSAKTVTVSTVAANGGQVMQMVVVPEPGAIALAGVGIALAGWTLRGRRRR